MMTPKNLHILQHALGVDEYGRGQQYRNYFATGPGSEDFDACEELTTQGFMTKHPGREITGGSPCYRVTREGIQAMHEASPKPPKLSLSKRRYLAWRRTADAHNLTFIEWLRSIPWRREQGYDCGD